MFLLIDLPTKKNKESSYKLQYKSIKKITSKSEKRQIEKYTKK